MAVEALDKKRLEQKSIALAKELEEEKKVRASYYKTLCAYRERNGILYERSG